MRLPILAGNGAYPLLASPAESLPDEALFLEPLGKHRSFTDRGEFDAPPGHGLVQEHIDRGFGLLFATRADAEAHLGSQIATAPLGCVSKTKETGQWKHRVVMDLRMNGVNAASATPERQVLPSVFDHALDLATLAATPGQGKEEQRIETMVLYFADAFMSIPLAGAERPFNTCRIEAPLKRQRAPLYKGEPAEGQVVAWRVLSFGGKSNPLTYSR